MKKHNHKSLPKKMSYLEQLRHEKKEKKLIVKEKKLIGKLEKMHRKY